jgi:hypothetical protein
MDVGAADDASPRWWAAALRRPPWRFGSGPDVAALFGTLLALVFLIAWISLGVQVRRLVGSHGLLPVEDLVERARSVGVASWKHLPTIFLWTQSDGALTAGIVAGVALALAALLGLGRRLCFALSTALYLSYAVACGTFLGFQWDNLLLECGLLAAFLPANRPAPVAHFLFRALLFKLYFESGIAKWQSPLGDWQDGSAMTYYYETAPLPTALAHLAHAAPAWWHHFESRATLVLELVVPFAIFGPRRARLGAAAALTLFQLVNAATANYGFFCYLATALHVFLLDDRDVTRLRRFLRPRPAAAPPALAGEPYADAARLLDRLGAAGGAALYLGVSLVQGLLAFGGGQPGPALLALGRLVQRDDVLRLVNTYHLFAAVTRERIEPEFQTLAPGRDEADQSAWVAHDLRYKAGAVSRRPAFVAPHQPRLDFQLWFHGLSFQRSRPAYVHVLLERMCEDADAVRPFFADDARAALPAHPRAVRVVYWQYHFTTPAERRATGAWWRRAPVAAAPAIRCAVAP